MHAKTRFLSVAVLLFAAAISGHGQQPAQDEFVSVLRRFGIILPPNYAEFKTNLDLTVGENKFYGAIYRWALASDQAVISYATGSLDLEAQADVYLPAQSYEPRYKTEKVKHEYELDDHGNWIKRKTFALKDKGPVPTLVTYRTITYYK